MAQEPGLSLDFETWFQLRHLKQSSFSRIHSLPNLSSYVSSFIHSLSFIPSLLLSLPLFYSSRFHIHLFSLLSFSHSFIHSFPLSLFYLSLSSIHILILMHTSIPFVFSISSHSFIPFFSFLHSLFSVCLTRTITNVLPDHCCIIRIFD